MITAVKMLLKCALLANSATWQRSHTLVVRSNKTLIVSLVESCYQHLLCCDCKYNGINSSRKANDKSFQQLSLAARVLWLLSRRETSVHREHQLFVCWNRHKNPHWSVLVCMVSSVVCFWFFCFLGHRRRCFIDKNKLRSLVQCS